MGLHGSSTTAVILQDVKVPAENLLGEVGKGHKVAFNVLNFGRFKLGGMCIGGSRAAIGEAATVCRRPKAVRATDRHLRRDSLQARRDDRPDLRRRKPALPDGRDDRRAHRRRAARRERRLGLVGGVRGIRHGGVDREGRRQRDARLRARREHPDPRRQRLREGLPGRTPLPRRARESDLRRHQRDQPAARFRACWRAGRIKGEVPIIAAAKALQDELLGPPALPSATDAGDSPLAEERRAVEAFKKTALMVFGLAMQTYGQKLADQQEVLMNIADIMIDVFSAESAVLRAAAAELDARRMPRFMPMPRGYSSTTRPCASTPPPARRSRP